MIENATPLGLPKKYDVQISIQTLAWENILPTIASAQVSTQIGFGSYAEYLTKEAQLNPPGSDPVVFIYPAYIYRGGAFVSFNAAVPILTPEALNNPVLVKRFLSYRIGVQKGSIYEMMIYSLAAKVGVDPKSLHLVDTPLNSALLAAEQGSLDIAEAGLTQNAETVKRGGKTVLSMDDMGFADITGFICKRSVLDQHPAEVQAAIHMWFDSVNYVMTDLDKNSAASLSYLNANAATKYTLDQYKQALSQEYFPRNTSEAASQILSPEGKFSYQRIGESMTSYLVATGKVRTAPILPSFISVP